jgi:hypothetical protein
MDIKRIIREEMDDMSWIKDVPDTVPSLNNRLQVHPKELVDSYLRGDDYAEDLAEYLEEEGYIDLPRDEDGEWDTWNWLMERRLNDWEIRDYLEDINNNEWEYTDQVTVDYDLEYSSSTELMVFKRKSDNRYFGYSFIYNYHDGDDGGDTMLKEYFPKEVTKIIWR